IKWDSLTLDGGVPSSWGKFVANMVNNSSPYKSYEISQYNNTGRIMWSISTGPAQGDIQEVISPELGSYANSDWVFVVGTWSSGEKMKLYINDGNTLVEAESPNDISGQIYYNNNQPLTIGGSNLSQDY
ncbi:LamG-like jellyroll fold domain-containing protein, partial [Arthrospira platensis SPKY2]